MTLLSTIKRGECIFHVEGMQNNWWPEGRMWRFEILYTEILMLLSSMNVDYIPFLESRESRDV